MDVLLTSIEEYKSQLDRVSTALEVAGEDDKPGLQELQLDLIQILELTLGQLEQQQAGVNDEIEVNSTTEAPKATNSSRFDEELALFKAEIAELSENNSPSPDPIQTENTSNTEEEEMLLQLKSLEGNQVRVPFYERWGGYSYHNAVVLSIVKKDEHPDYDNPKVVVLYSQPTSPSMLPCRFYLNGHCKFDSEQCKFSHGEEIALSDIKSYEEPNFDSVQPGSKVLALHKQDIWHKGTIEDMLEDRSSMSLKCEVCIQVVEVSLQSVVPLHATDEDEIVQDTEIEDKYGVETDEVEDLETDFVPNDQWLHNTLSSSLGEWEKHTKGIASKLMERMGYIKGAGLGPKGTGRVDPVKTYVYPQGVSLDRCMELREASNGEELLEVEKRLKKLQKKEEIKQKRQEDSLHQKTSVFDIINTKLDGSSSSMNQRPQTQKMDVSKNSLKRNTTKELNRKNLQIFSHIQQLEVEINKLKQTRERQASDASTIKTIDTKLSDKITSLKSLREAENQILKEQKERKDAKKSFVF